MPPWLSSLFVHPEYVLPGAALLSLPLIIHFINRLRFRRVKFAAMEFLLASQQRNRRRILLEQLLLLLLRLIVVAALVMLVARPLLNPEQFNLLRGQKTHHVVLLDDSGSMGDRWGETTAFEAGKEVIRKIAAEGERKPDSQLLTLLVATNPDQPVLNQESLNTDFTNRLETTLKALRGAHRRVNLAAGAAAASRMLVENPGGARSFHLISDFREEDWADDSAIVDAFRQMRGDKIAVNLIKTVPEAHANLGITDLNGAVDVAAANVPLRLSATIRNYGEQVAQDVRMTVLVDGKRLPTTEVIDKLDPGKELVREFDVIFPTIGAHDVQVSLPADALEQDNHRYLSLDLPDANAVLIVSSNVKEAHYLADALAPAPGLTGFAPSIETIEYLRRRPIDRFQSVFLLNVADLPPDAVAILEKYVAAGGGLVWYLGDQVRPAFYNDKLYRDGKGLFPCRLATPAELPVDETAPLPDVVFGSHPLFRVFEGNENPFINLMMVSRYFTVPRDWGAPEGVDEIATLRNKAPVMFEHRFEKGRVVTCLTALGNLDWDNWSRIAPAFVPLQLETARYIARSDRSLERRITGEEIVISLDAASYLPQVEVRPPDGIRIPIVLGLKGAPTEEKPDGDNQTTGVSNAGARFEDVFRKTDEPGLYSLALKHQDSTGEIRRYAFNVPESESHLQLVTSERIQRRLGADVSVQIQEPGDFSWVQGEAATHDLHDYVLIGLLALLLGEQALALRLGYHPKTAGGRA